MTTINEGLGIQVTRGRLNPTEYKRIAEWLNCYTYIIPSERRLHRNLVEGVLYYNNIYTSSMLFKFWLIFDCIETCFNLTEQERILKYYG